MKYYLHIDTYKSGKRTYPRICVVSENGGGTRLLGPKFSMFPQNNLLIAQITPDMIGNLLCELGVKEETINAAVSDIKKEMEKPNGK